MLLISKNDLEVAVKEYCDKNDFELLEIEHSTFTGFTTFTTNWRGEQTSYFVGLKFRYNGANFVFTKIARGDKKVVEAIIDLKEKHLFA